MRPSVTSMLFQAVMCLTTGCTIASAQTSTPIRYELPNGLRVILRPISGAQQTAVLTLFSIGGDHDPPGQSGLAHLIEHLYVTAAAGNRPSRPAEELMRSYPAGWNAQTGDDYTVFATVVDPGSVDSELEHHAMRMGNLRITEADLKRELPRINQELTNMFGGIPSIAASNLAREKVRPTPNDGRKGGRFEHISQIPLSQVQDHWQRFYKPCSAIIVVAGAFDAKQTRDTIKTAFGSLPSGKPVPAASRPSTAKPPAAELIEVKPIQLGLPSTVSLTFAVPAASSADYPAFLILFNRLMMQSPPAAFNASTIEPTLRYALLDDPNALSIVVTMKPDESPEEAEARLRAFVNRAVNAPWQNDETAVAIQNRAFFLGTMPLPDAAMSGNVYGVAFSLGRREQLGLDGKALAKKLDRVRAIGVKRLANKYFSADSGAVVAVRAKN